MEGEIDAMPSASVFELGDHPAEKVLVRLRRDPARPGPGPGPERRFDADQFDAGMLARHLHEAAHVGPRLPGEQRLAAGRRTVMDEVVERGVVGQERHRLVDEVQNGDAECLSHRGGSRRSAYPAYSPLPPPWRWAKLSVSRCWV